MRLRDLFLATVGFGVVISAADDARADDAANPVTANVGIYSQYVFRGLTQTNERPAIQGGCDYAHKSGFYAGTWLSNISWFSDTNPGNSSSLEWDLYGGYKRSWAGGVATDVGYLRYEYPGSYRALPLGTVEPNSNEVYASVGWKWITFKYSHAIDDLFGVEDSGGSEYFDLTAAVPINAKLTVTAHAGTQQYRGTSSAARMNGTDNNSLYSYDDYRAGLTYAFASGWSAGASYSHTNARDIGYTVLGKNLGDDQFVVSVSRTF